MLVADPDRFEDETEAGESTDTGVEGLDDPRAIAGPACPHCHQPQPEKSTTVCPHCGYYASLGICVDVDAQWERLAGTQTATAADAAAEKPKSHVQVWLELLPPWGWQLVGYNVLILLASVAARLLLPEGVVRTLWSVTQLVVGISAFITCHILAYLIAISEDASMSPLDVILKPIVIWQNLARKLPEKLRIAAGASCGITATVASLLIVGSLNYAVLLDWGFKQPAKSELADAIADREQPDGGAAEQEKPKETMDCVIIGYRTTGSNPERITTLVLAREHLGRVIYIGTIRGEFDEELQQQLEAFREIPRDEPYVAIPVVLEANWLQPSFACRVKYISEDAKTGRLQGMEYDTLLGRLRL